MIRPLLRTALGLALALAAFGTAGPASSAAAAATPAVRVSGNQLVDATGQPIRLLGVDRSGTEYACAQGWGIFDGPSDAASIAAIASWHANAVRVPLNEDCWLGINGVPAAYAGSAYRSAVQAYVAALNAAGLVAILDLHWSAPGGSLALGQQVMADEDHSPAFWSSVAATFAADPGVVFDLYNEPHDISWACWRDGCTTPAGWATAGMQQLVDAVRAAGAHQPIMLGGLGWASDLTGWLAYEPVDPLGQLVASFHVYDFSGCHTASCWDATVAPVAAKVPVVTGEVGESDCGGGFLSDYLPWADAHGVSYLGWAWDTWNCAAGPALISGYDGAPTPFGSAYRGHLADEAASAREAAACPQGAFPAPNDTDIGSGAAATVIACVTGWQVAYGVSATSYAPSRVVTREQMASFLARAIRASGGTLPAGAAAPFPDVPATDVHAADIAALAAAGIAEGTSDGNFHPAAPVTRGQLAELAVRALDYRLGSPVADPAPVPAFTDDAGNPAQPAIETAAAASVVTGYPDDTYRPAGSVTRAQMATYLARVLGVLVVRGVCPVP